MFYRENRACVDKYLYIQCTWWVNDPKNTRELFVQNSISRRNIQYCHAPFQPQSHFVNSNPTDRWLSMKHDRKTSYQSPHYSTFNRKRWTMPFDDSKHNTPNYYGPKTSEALCLAPAFRQQTPANPSTWRTGATAPSAQSSRTRISAAEMENAQGQFGSPLRLRGERNIKDAINLAPAAARAALS